MRSMPCSFRRHRLAEEQHSRGRGRRTNRRPRRVVGAGGMGQHPRTRRPASGCSPSRGPSGNRSCPPTVGSTIAARSADEEPVGSTKGESAREEDRHNRRRRRCAHRIRVRGKRVRRRSKSLIRSRSRRPRTTTSPEPATTSTTSTTQAPVASRHDHDGCRLRRTRGSRRSVRIDQDR